MNEFIVILPARLSSSRLPEKALADICGEPMIVRAAKQALQTNAQRVIVATDHQRIQSACLAHQIDCIMTSQQHESGTTRLAEAVQLLDLPNDMIIVNVQGDEPLIPPKLIEQVANKLSGSHAPMATAAHPIHDFAEFTNPNCVKVVLNQKDNALYFSRAPIAYPRDTMLANKTTLPDYTPLRHVGVYAYRVDFLKKYEQLTESPLEFIEKLEQLRVLWHGFDIAVEVLNFVPPIGVDTADDLKRVRCLFQQMKKIQINNQ